MINLKKKDLLTSIFSALCNNFFILKEHPFQKKTKGLFLFLFFHTCMYFEWSTINIFQSEKRKKKIKLSILNKVMQKEEKKITRVLLTPGEKTKNP